MNKSKFLIPLLGLVGVCVVSSAGYFAWHKWHHGSIKPGYIASLQPAPTTSVFDFHELKIKITLPDDLKDLKYFDLTDPSGDFANLNLYMQSYTDKAKICFNTTTTDQIPITVVRYYAGKYSDAKSKITSFDLLREDSAGFVVIQKPYQKKCTDGTKQTDFDTYDKAIYDEIANTIKTAAKL